MTLRMEKQMHQWVDLGLEFSSLARDTSVTGDTLKLFSQASWVTVRTDRAGLSVGWSTVLKCSTPLLCHAQCMPHWLVHAHLGICDTFFYLSTDSQSQMGPSRFYFQILCLKIKKLICRKLNFLSNINAKVGLSR